MIKKITLASLIVTCASSVYADSMGYGDTPYNSAFFSVEGGYTRNAIDGFEFTVIGTNNAVVSTEDNQPYSVRLAAGLMSRVYDNFAVSGELGWGYYGRTNSNPVGTGLFASSPDVFSLSHTLSGFDILVGAIWTQPCYNLFIKAGALIENMNTKTNAIFDPAAFTFTDTFQLESSNSEALPEIKIGGSYNFNENWALTVAYFHAFGNSNKTTATFNPVTGASTFNSNTQNPSLDGLLIGVQVSV